MTREAAKHAIEDNLTVHDAYHLATALKSKINYFVTRDVSLSKKEQKYVRAVVPEHP